MDRVQQSESFRSEARLRTRREFQRLYEEGRKLHGRFMTVFVRPNARETSRLGVTATRKLGGAVQRNRVKRRVRELFRRHRPPAGRDIVVVPKREFLGARFGQLEADYAAILQRSQEPARRAESRPPRQTRP